MITRTLTFGRDATFLLCNVSAIKAPKITPKKPQECGATEINPILEIETLYESVNENRM